jgi:magnesium chelatase family protein
MGGAQAERAESSTEVRERVVAARQQAAARGHGPNACLRPADIDTYCLLEKSARSILEQAIARLGLSARAYHRILRVARTVADLAAADTINAGHVAEAIGYRQLDRNATS